METAPMTMSISERYLRAHFGRRRRWPSDHSIASTAAKTLATTTTTESLTPAGNKSVNANSETRIARSAKKPNTVQNKTISTGTDK